MVGSINVRGLGPVHGGTVFGGAVPARAHLLRSGLRRVLARICAIGLDVSPGKYRSAGEGSCHCVMGTRGSGKSHHDICSEGLGGEQNTRVIQIM